MSEKSKQFFNFKHSRKATPIKPPAKRCSRCDKKFADDFLTRIKGRLMCEECFEGFTL